MKKEIVITRIMEFGGNNTYLKNLITYFGESNLIIVLKSSDDLQHAYHVDPERKADIRMMPCLLDYARLKRKSPFYNLKELAKICLSLLAVLALSIRNGCCNITISVIEPEKYLYLLCLPFIKVKFILHTEPLTPKNPLTTFICKHFLGPRKRIVTVSQANRYAILEKWKISPGKEKYLHVVYNCLAADQKISRGRLEKKQPVVLTMGHVEEYKNPDVWLKVARQVTGLRRGTEFCWLGSGYFLGDFRKRSAVNEGITFAGIVRDTSIYLREATVYYQPSLSETQGISVIEAMAHHLPCVVSNVGGLPESVSDGENGFVVDAGDVDEHVGRILSLLDDSELSMTLGEKGYEKYQSHFTFDAFKEKMDIVYAL